MRTVLMAGIGTVGFPLLFHLLYIPSDIVKTMPHAASIAYVLMLTILGLGGCISLFIALVVLLTGRTP